MSASPARRVFFASLGAATLLGLVDAFLVASHPREGLDLAGRLLAVAYALSPWVSGSAFVGGIAAALVLVWSRTRPRVATHREGTPAVTSDGPALLLAVLAFALLFFVTSRVVATRTHHRGLGAVVLAFALPALALSCTHLWFALRRVLGRLDEGRVGPAWLRPSRVLGAGVLAFLVSLAIATLARNEALREAVGVWPPLFVGAWPLLVGLAATGLRDRAPDWLSAPWASRLAHTLALVGAVGVADLVRSMDARPAVKAALLESTLVFQAGARLAQNLFDADRDGYAGALGGGDCDDQNAAVYPGAPEVPLNGIDDDCFGGDSTTADVESEGTGATEVPSTEDFPRPETLVRPNLLHITIDTLAATRVGAWGYPRSTTPNLDALAARGLRFAWAFSQGAQTKVSMPSIFTGRYFSEVDRSPDSWATVWPENVTLAERLRDAGYHTAGFPAHRFFLPAYGLHQGFLEWDLSLVERYGRDLVNVSTSEATTDRTRAWLRSRKPDDPPFYLWVHYFDPHHFYQSHDAPTDLGDQDSDRYDEEVRFTDQHLGRLLETLETQGLTSSTYIVLHGDHGEGFGEHGYRYHGQHLFNDQVHVPLVLVGPALPQRVVEHPVALLDLKPTLLDLAGLPRPRELSGHSLLPFASTRPGARRSPVFIEMMRDSNHSDRRAIVEWPWKFQWGITFDERTLFNLADDPNERNDLASVSPEEAERLNRRLRAWMASEVRTVQPRR